MARNYEQHKEDMGERMRAKALIGREIGPIPDIKDIPRRDSCRFDLEKFGYTYCASSLTTGGTSWPLCDDMREAIQRIQDTTLTGSLFALGRPRGFAKTTWIRIGALWAVSYRHRRYPFIIGATAPKAIKSLTSLQNLIRFLEDYGADFPEIAFPVRRLKGITQNVRGQICLGESTMMRWDVDEIILPTVPPPNNWPKEWALRSDGMVPTAGSCISVSGLTGDGIRGSLTTLDTGELLRPDLVLLDDPQSRESAKSDTQNDLRIELVSGDLLGMAAPGQKMAAVMLCTPIYPGDMADVMLDDEKHPLWRGDRKPMMRSMPKNMHEWDKYFPLYIKCAKRKPPDFTEANAYYEENRVALDEGAEPAWAECYDHESEVSAIQSAMHLYVRDPRAFAAERQLTPLAIFDAASDLPKLTVDHIQWRHNNHDRGVVPAWATTLTCHIDVHDSLLFYSVVAWGESFGGAIIDYGAWPQQQRTYFSLRDVHPSLEKETGYSKVEQAIYAGLKGLTDDILGREWEQEQGVKMRIRQCLIDCGYKDETIFRFCRESKYAPILLASKGYGITAAKSPMADWKAQPGEKRQKGVSPMWIVRSNVGKGRYVLFDSNMTKTLLVERLLVADGDRSALKIFKGEHRLYAAHLTAEFRVRTEGRGRRVDQWEPKPGGPENHFWDTLVGATLAASIQGIVVEKTGVEKKKSRPLAEIMGRTG